MSTFQSDLRSHFGKLVLAGLLLGLSIGAASCGLVDAQGQCIDVSGKDWKDRLDVQFGKDVCLSGRLFPGADGVFYVVDPPWGFPPYGALISTSMKQKQAYELGVRPGDHVALRGVLIGRDFCNRTPSSDGCGQTDAKWFEYYLFNAQLVSKSRSINR